MTREEILGMKPGRELDALVAVNIFKQEHILETYQGNYIGRPFYGTNFNDHGDFEYVPNYSTDMSAAWQVVEKKQTFPYSISRHNNGKWSINWCSFNYECMNCDEVCTGKFEIETNTVPEAICKMALLASLEV